MIKNVLSNIKRKIAVFIAVIIALCFGLVTFGCGKEKDENPYEYAIRIAKEFGCEKILWHEGGIYYNEVSSVYLYQTYGSKSPVPHESVFDHPGGGSYVLGVDKFGSELFIAIPNKESTMSNPKKFSPRLIQWPFEYSFTEIASFAAEHGYKYADGIDGFTNDQLDDYYKYSFEALNHNFMNFSFGNITEGFTKYFDDADKKYDELDVKFVFHYSAEQNEDGRTDYYITQEGDKLVLYEKIRTELEDYTVIYSMSEVATHRRRELKDAINIARTDFGCVKMLWVDWARPQNNVLENNDIPNGGYYIIGEDKDGNEVYVVVPYYETDKYKASAFKWKFDYTFSQIARVFAKYGYQYADGIDCMEDKYIGNYDSITIDLRDDDDDVQSALAQYGDADELYEKLDVKLVFNFCIREGNDWHDFWLTQQGGSLVVDETVNGDCKSTVTTVYDKDDI